MSRVDDTRATTEVSVSLSLSFSSPTFTFSSFFFSLSFSPPASSSRSLSFASSCEIYSRSSAANRVHFPIRGTCARCTRSRGRALDASAPTCSFLAKFQACVCVCVCRDTCACKSSGKANRTAERVGEISSSVSPARRCNNRARPPVRDQSYSGNNTLT